MKKSYVILLQAIATPFAVLAAGIFIACLRVEDYVTDRRRDRWLDEQSANHYRLLNGENN